MKLPIQAGAYAAATALALSCATVSAQSESPFIPAVDTDGNGLLSQSEFVMALGDREYGRRDVNKDNIMSKEEWLGGGGDFQKLTFERFNQDGDNVMSAKELVEVFIWIFANRDKNRDGSLDKSEAPAFLLAK